ncbi:MAG: LPS assembly protein LptD [Pseudomonadota bacterium]
MRSLILALCLALLATAAAAQQGSDRVALFADRIRYDNTTQQIVASGNVDVYFQNNRLTAGAIRYDGNTGTIRAEGEIRLESSDGVVILASLAELSDDFQDGLVQGARLILNEQFQVAAVEGAREGGRFNSFFKTVASSCSVCEDHPRPIWRIRARRVTHDEERQRLYFDNAFLDIFGLPVLYLPRMRVPQPGVARDSGFLIPEFENSDIFGLGVKLPYYFTLGDHADLTVTPFLTTGGAVILENEYRQKFRNGQLDTFGIISLTDGLDADEFRGFLSLDGDFDLPRDFLLEFSLNGVSDRSFLAQFDYTRIDRLESFISLNRVRETTFFDARLEGFQSLRDISVEPQSEIAQVLPQIAYRQVHTDTLGGTLGLEAGALGLVREEGIDSLRLSAAADWERDVVLPFGLVAKGIAAINGQAYTLNDAPGFDDGVLGRFTPTIGAELRWPLSRTGRRATTVIEPIAQVLYSETIGDEDVPNEDSLQPEFDETNLFALNRFPGIDAQETGFRLNVGGRITRYDASGIDVAFTFGQVFRDTLDNDFPDFTGLASRASDYVTALTVTTPQDLDLTGRALFDEDLEFERAEFEIDYSLGPFDFFGSYTFLDEEPDDPFLGFIAERQEFALEGRYQVNPNWAVRGAWRFDITDRESLFAGGGVTFGNECLFAELDVGRRFTDFNAVPPSTEVSFKVELTGFGAKGRDFPARVCRGI